MKKNVKREKKSTTIVGVGSTVMQEEVIIKDEGHGKPKEKNSKITFVLHRKFILFYSSLLTLLSHNVGANVVVIFILLVVVDVN